MPRSGERYGIAEWYGRPFLSLDPEQRAEFAHHAQLRMRSETPVCPFQKGAPNCSKKGGVCSIQRYTNDEGYVGAPVGEPVITCPKRFEQSALAIRWLAEIAGFPATEILVAREIPFMVKKDGKPAGKIDLVVGHDAVTGLRWHGLEIQAVYFSGRGMPEEFAALQRATDERPPFPLRVRRPDWRSSSAKRLMPQLSIEVPTLRRWGAKLAVAVDKPFFSTIGGPSDAPSQDLNEGDIIWLVTRLESNPAGELTLRRHHWEMLTLEESEDRLLAADPMTRHAFEHALRSKLRPLDQN
ncbi:MAG: NotI family restriction endonuclease [bacterium]|nr:NotI family restriction endonuclease [bacterium]MDE0351166.1 NotI family restriction endonuclease [bacterium]